MPTKVNEVTHQDFPEELRNAERTCLCPQIAAVAEWKSLQARLRSKGAEAFTGDGQVLNLLEGKWKDRYAAQGGSETQPGQEHVGLSSNWGRL
jgi:hypothetical protein